MSEINLRDYFAAKALQGLLSASEIQQILGRGITPEEIVRSCYEWADLMIKARSLNEEA